MKKKLQIFVSSTFTDLKKERQAAVEAILKSGNIPAGMELFTAGNESQLDTIKRWINESDVYCLILGGRYGSIEPQSKKSYTEIEYDYAKSIEKPTFAVVITDEYLNKKVKENNIDFIERENSEKLKQFRDKVLSNISSFYESPNDIKLAIHETLEEFKERYNFSGWIPGNNETQNAKLLEENSKLKDRILQLEQLNNYEEVCFKVPDLAEMTDYYQFYCLYYPSGSNEPIKKEMNFTWNELFASIAPWVLDNPEDKIAKAALLKLCRTSIGEKIKLEDLFIENEILQAIKIQFMANGLIDSSGYSWDLTNKGRSGLLMLKAIRKENA